MQLLKKVIYQILCEKAIPPSKNGFIPYYEKLYAECKHFMVHFFLLPSARSFTQTACALTIQRHAVYEKMLSRDEIVKLVQLASYFNTPSFAT